MFIYQYLLSCFWFNVYHRTPCRVKIKDNHNITIHTFDFSLSYELGLEIQQNFISSSELSNFAC